MSVWLKAIHIVALCIWCGGLLVLPGLFARRQQLADEELHQLHNFTRSVFIRVVSPAAFVAVAAGMALIFAQGVFTLWMITKLFVVGALAVIHIREGFLVLNLFKPGHRYSRIQQIVATTTTAAVIVVILWLVLAKPPLQIPALPRWMVDPGGLHSLLESLMPTP